MAIHGSKSEDHRYMIWFFFFYQRYMICCYLISLYYHFFIVIAIIPIFYYFRIFGTWRIHYLLSSRALRALSQDVNFWSG